MVDCLSDLSKEYPYFGQSERSIHFLVHQLVQVTVAKLIDDIDAAFANEHFMDLDNVLVIESLQRLNLSDELLRDPLLSLANLDFLQCNDSVASLIDGSEDRRVRPLADALNNAIVPILLALLHLLI